MSDLERLRYFLTRERFGLCAWALARLLWLHQRLRSADAGSRRGSAAGDPVRRLRRRVRSRGLPRLLSELETGAGDPCQGDHRQALERAEDLWRFLNFVLIRVLRRRDVCLLRGLVLFEFLRGRGLPVAIHCGVQNSSGRLSGHCWVSLAGRPLFETRDPAATFQVMLSHPGEGERS